MEHERTPGRHAVDGGLPRSTAAAAAATGIALAGLLAVGQLGGRDQNGAVGPQSAGLTTTARPTSSSTPSVTLTSAPAPSPKLSSHPSTPTTTPSQAPPSPTKAARAKALTTGTPLSISAPAIDVDGPLRRTSAVNGIINPPGGVLAWVSGYDRVQPGEVGTAVVAGHVVANGRPDVFYRLQEIRRGARITVWDSDGKPVVYTVTSTKVATKSAVTRDAAVWGANRSVRRIALITCDDDNGYRADGHRVSNFVAIAEAR